MAGMPGWGLDGTTLVELNQCRSQLNYSQRFLWQAGLPF